MYIRRASSPSTVLWAFHTIQPSSWFSVNFNISDVIFKYYFIMVALCNKADHNIFMLFLSFFFCRPISSQLRHVSTIGKKLVKQQYLLDMLPQYGELRLSRVWDRFGSLGHPSYFQRFPRLGSVTARQPSSERQPNFAALNRGRHLCSAGRPSRWALAHISIFFKLLRIHIQLRERQSEVTRFCL